MELITNPFAPQAYEGIVGKGAQFVDADYTPIYTVTLTANQEIRGAVVSLDMDADFLLMGLIISTFTSINFQLQLFDNQQQNLSSDYVYAAAYLVGGIQVPFAFVPGRIFPAGGRIGINIKDTSGADNTIQLAFRGVKRYRLQ
jgi:hypothetical protein